MKQQTTEGIVLSRIDYGEADRIITFLTPEMGKVRVIAKGVRKQKSKLAGGIELFSVCTITYIEGKSDIKTLVSTRLQTHYGQIVKDIDRTMLGYEILKILSKLLEDEGGQEYYDLLLSSLEALDNLETPKDLAEASFLLRLMRLLGHLPEFTHDIKGRQMSSNDSLQFSFDDMAFFVAPSGPFSLNHVKLLRLLGHNPPGSLFSVKDLAKYLSELTPLVRQMSRQYLVSF